MEQSFLYALLAACFAAASRVLYRQAALASQDTWATMQMVCMGAFLLVWLLFGTPHFSGISPQLMLLLSGVGALWVIIAFCNFRASRFLDASHSALLDSLSVVLMAICGFSFFGENLAPEKILGIGLVGLAVVCHVLPSRTRISAGMGFKVVALILTTTALSLDKLLTEITGTREILFVGFLVPALTYLILCRGSIASYRKIIQQSRGRIFLLPFFSVGRLYCTLAALSSGGLLMTYAVLQSEIILVQIYEIIALRDWTHFQRRMLASAACIAGVLLIRM